MATNDCEDYPDIFEEPKANATAEERARFKEKNDSRERIYLAVRDVLRKDFGISGIPEEPQNFKGSTMKDEDRAQFTAILGLILADNWDDPTNGKTEPGADDRMHRGDAKNERFVIDRRFIEAVVDAVKEYTASSELFNKVFKLMRAEAAEGLNKPRTPSPSLAA